LPQRNNTDSLGDTETSIVKDLGQLEGFKDESIQILSNIQKIKQIYLSLVRSAQKEVLLIFPSTNAIRREQEVGIFNELKRAAQRAVTVRILTPEDDFVKSTLDELRPIGINVRRIETPAEAKFKLLIADSRFSLVIETKDDAKSRFEEAVGLATFSNSKPTVMPYVAIFESFWRETDLYEKAREADRVKDEFVNIAAHELRNPISPIIASGDFAREDLKKIREGRFDDSTIASLNDNINMMIRNAAKLFKLAEDILQVSRIESGTFTLNIEEVKIKQALELAIEDARKKIENGGKELKIILDYRLGEGSPKGDVSLYCDSSKINQVLYNLLDNAIKFSYSGDIVVSAMHNDSSIVFKVEDSGKGIDPAIKDRLFEKFSTKSDSGTGLGLFLSKKIVEAHGGRIWASDNASGKGATFSFTIPTDLQSTMTAKKSNVPEPPKKERSSE
jgi:signal transduction histidine kinase